jgi:hypothetical protein
MQYTQAHIEMAKKFLANKNVGFDYDADDKRISISIDVDNNRIWTDGSGIWNNKVVKGVKVEGIYLNADYYDYDDEDAYWSGGLAGSIAYDGSGVDGTWYDGADVENNALINKIKDEQDSDGMIYTDDGFINNSIKYMVEQCDFDNALIDYLSFDYSEQGMQDDGYVNLDVELDGNFWLAVKEQMDEDNLKLQAKAFA